MKKINIQKGRKANKKHPAKKRLKNIEINCGDGKTTIFVNDISKLAIWKVRFPEAKIVK